MALIESRFFAFWAFNRKPTIREIRFPAQPSQRIFCWASEGNFALRNRCIAARTAHYPSRHGVATFSFLDDSACVYEGSGKCSYFYSTPLDTETQKRGPYAAKMRFHHASRRRFCLVSTSVFHLSINSSNVRM